MSRPERLRTVALLGRTTGLSVLRETLLDHPALELTGVYTHGRLTRAEGDGVRPELDLYEQTCRDRGIPLHVLDLPEARELDVRLPPGRIDLMVVLSWRCILPGSVLRRCERAAINLHRGALPAYRGALPVQRAIENGESRVAITAHHMVEEVDAGAPIAVVHLNIAPLPDGMDSAAYAERVKPRLHGLYAPLAHLAIEAVLA